MLTIIERENAENIKENINEMESKGIKIFATQIFLVHANAEGIREKDKYTAFIQYRGDNNAQ